VDPVVLSGVLIGAMLPFLFAALTMLSVQKVCVCVPNTYSIDFDLVPRLTQYLVFRPRSGRWSHYH
jgi:K(+)-stimulated pyrophosphate-energized sodium pump